MRWRLSMLLLASFVLASPFRAQAGDWEKSFPSQSVGSFLARDRESIVVVPSGNPSPELDRAVAALIAAFRESPRTKLVMDTVALGSIAGLDDSAIVNRCGALPINTVAVVHVFPSRCVVFLYDTRGNVGTAFSAKPGVPMLPAAGFAVVGQGVSADAARAVDKVTDSMWALMQVEQSDSLPVVVSRRFATVSGSLIVIPAGPSATGAADAVRDVLRRMAKFRIHEADTSAAETYDDLTIARGCAPMKVDQVVVVRAYAGRAGEPSHAVVMIYGPDGKLSGSFSATLGAPP